MFINLSRGKKIDIHFIYFIDYFKWLIQNYLETFRLLLQNYLEDFKLLIQNYLENFKLIIQNYLDNLKFLRNSDSFYSINSSSEIVSV